MQTATILFFFFLSLFFKILFSQISNLRKNERHYKSRKPFNHAYFLLFHFTSNFLMAFALFFFMSLESYRREVKSPLPSRPLCFILTFLALFLSSFVSFPVTSSVFHVSFSSTSLLIHHLSLSLPPSSAPLPSLFFLLFLSLPQAPSSLSPLRCSC